MPCSMPRWSQLINTVREPKIKTLKATKLSVAVEEGQALLFHTTCDVLGNPTGFHLRAARARDLEGADVLLAGIEAEALLADRALDG